MGPLDMKRCSKAGNKPDRELDERSTRFLIVLGVSGSVAAASAKTKNDETVKHVTNMCIF